MAEAGRLNLPAAPESRTMVRAEPVTVVRAAIIVFVLLFWEAIAQSGLLYRDVVPSLLAIGHSLIKVLTGPIIQCPVEFGIGPLFGFGPYEVKWEFSEPEYYCHLGRTAAEVGAGLLVGGLSGLLIGLVFGGNRTLSKSFEPYLYYLGPTPKIIFFPVMIMWFGVGPGSKVAMGAISCFFPIALSTAAGMRQIDKVLIRVGRSFRANAWQMATKIYLPAMRHPIINGVRLGLGVAIIGTLLAETKLSNRGVGFLIIQAYSLFDMPRMYAMLIVLFIVAIGANALVGRLGGLSSIRQR
jgi:NitT/TauT family transport system permease protein